MSSSDEAYDATGYGDDPMGLKNKGKFWNASTEEGKQLMPEFLLVTAFLKETFPQPIVNRIAGPFARKLQLRVRSERFSKRVLYKHMLNGRPRVSYFNADRDMMNEVLDEMSESIKVAAMKAAEPTARTVRRAIGWLA
ncbi:MAG: hypothetical protein EBZ36_14140 [Acidobacteria bacterium]|nr:hypothetical protein [Acidobacteriota bacterium]